MKYKINQTIPKKFEIKLTANERFPLLSAIEFSDDELGKPK